jgi:hypothetical protein
MHSPENFQKLCKAAVRLSQDAVFRQEEHQRVFDKFVRLGFVCGDASCISAQLANGHFKHTAICFDTVEVVLKVDKLVWHLWPLDFCTLFHDDT